jgi:hypothetical protein
MSMESSGGMILTGENRRNGEKTCPAFSLPTKNRTWSDSGVNPGLRDEGQATYPLNSARQWRTLPYNSISYPKILVVFWLSLVLLVRIQFVGFNFYACPLDITRSLYGAHVEIFSLLSKNGSRLIKSPACVWVPH